MHLKRGLPSVNFVKSMKGERILFYDFDLIHVDIGNSNFSCPLCRLHYVIAVLVYNTNR